MFFGVHKGLPLMDRQTVSPFAWLREMKTWTTADKEALVPRRDGFRSRSLQFVGQCVLDERALEIVAIRFGEKQSCCVVLTDQSVAR